MHLSVCFIGFLSLHAVSGTGQSQDTKDGVSEVQKLASQLARKAIDATQAKDQKAAESTSDTPAESEHDSSAETRKPGPEVQTSVPVPIKQRSIIEEVQKTEANSVSEETRKQPTDFAALIQAQKVELQQLRDDLDDKGRQIEDLQKAMAMLKETASKMQPKAHAPEAMEKTAFLEANVQVERDPTKKSGAGEEDAAKKEGDEAGKEEAGKEEAAPKSKSGSFFTPSAMLFLGIAAVAAADV